MKAIPEALIQAETQTVFPLGDQGDGQLGEGKGNDYINGRKALLSVQIS